MKRSTLVNIHLYFSGISLFILLLFITSGSLHLFGFKEEDKKTIVASIEIEEKLSKKDLENLLARELKNRWPGYRFDYIKGGDTSLTTRPTTRTFYTVQYSPDLGVAQISEHVPNINKRFMELHKGHGPKATRKILASIGVIFALAILSGLWLGLSVPRYRKITLITALSSLAIVFVLFSL